MAGERHLKQGQERRAAMLGFIREFTAEKGYAPSILEIANAVGLASPNGTRQHLQRLQAEGFLTLPESKQARAITLASPAPDGWQRTA